MGYHPEGSGKKRLRKSRWKKRRVGLLFISPWLIGFGVFTLYPSFASLYYSFTSYDVITAAHFVGLNNYKDLFFDDPLFWISMYNTFYYAALVIPLAIVVGIGAALLLNLKLRGITVFRTIFYLPAIVPIVGASIVWMWLLNPQVGIINSLLRTVGISGPGWLSNPTWSKPSLVIMRVWSIGGPMLIYLAALQDIPKSLYESAELDGANKWHSTIHITLPMLTAVIFFNLIMEVIGTFQYFTQVYVMTQGGPADSTLVYSLYLFNSAFRYFKMGYASSMAWILFLIVLSCTFLIFKSSRRWVYYAGGKGI